jgi:hypothetical protein
MKDSRLPGLRMNGIEYPISNKECPIMKSKSVPTRVLFQCRKRVLNIVCDTIRHEEAGKELSYFEPV